MNTILEVNKLRCPANHTCPAVTVCQYNALKQNGHNAPEVNMDMCGKCVRFCPMRALNLVKQ